MRSIDELLAVASPLVADQRDLDGDSVLELFTNTAGVGARTRLAELQRLLTALNGFSVFEDALKVYPVKASQPEVGLLDWNRSAGWIEEYEGLASGLFFFGEDLFANQFAIEYSGNIVRFAAETGTREFLAPDLEAWARVILDDHQYLTGWPIAREWKLARGSIRPGERLVPKRPFVIGGEYALENLMVLGQLEAMSFYAAIARQIKDLPDGAQVVLTVE